MEKSKKESAETSRKGFTEAERKIAGTVDIFRAAAALGLKTYNNSLSCPRWWGHKSPDPRWNGERTYDASLSGAITVKGDRGVWWRCHKCMHPKKIHDKLWGDAVDLVRYQLGSPPSGDQPEQLLSFSRAVKWLVSLHRGEAQPLDAEALPPEPEATSEKPYTPSPEDVKQKFLMGREPEPVVYNPDSPLYEDTVFTYFWSLLEPPRDQVLQYLLSRGLSETTIDTWGIRHIENASAVANALLAEFGHKTVGDMPLLAELSLFNATKGTFIFANHRLIIPFFEPCSNRVVYFQSRVDGSKVTSRHKFLNPRVRRHRLFSLISMDPYSDKPLHIVEGILDAVSLYELGIPKDQIFCIRGTGNYGNRYLWRFLVGREVVLWMDNDRDGENASYNMVNELAKAYGVKAARAQDLAKDGKTNGIRYLPEGSFAPEDPRHINPLYKDPSTGEMIGMKDVNDWLVYLKKAKNPGP